MAFRIQPLRFILVLLAIFASGLAVYFIGGLLLSKTIAIILALSWIALGSPFLARALLRSRQPYPGRFYIFT
ncbi:hypothetical protein [Lysobacter soyae]|uniref:Uncharacterized protein n=1 Tax=Lysobacter soyae TaxID=2764185 RepID=A0ABX8WPM9_9GAMM|nr:hypothetical protein [Lysobacter sp. CJ11]QYR52669.1 hypothetical protein H8L67_08770 [Lysobacter sp. CJ11]